MAEINCSGKHTPIWSVILFLLSVIVISGGIGYGKNEGMKSKNDTQDVRIENVEDDIDEIKGDLKGFRNEQRTFNSKLLEEIRKLTYQHENHDDD